MAIATDKQVQIYVDQRLRVRAESFRALVNAIRDDKSAIDDIYAACAQQTPTWTDTRTDGPPRLLTPQDVLVFNAFISVFDKVILGTATLQDVADLHGNFAVFQSACVRPAGS
jgi:hypothetical protein